ncbi:phospholipase D-like domain-containing protein [Halovenus amylolytica]|uniref:phospholipase D-like domain-containing protein n=1 Tax=Halovenus amylolytica TaxID=2500550 RepID=UPI0036101103
MTLLEAIPQLPDTEVTFVVRKGEDHNDFVRDRLPKDVEMIAVDDLHAKVVVCDEYAYVGSANVTHGGLTINREICKIVENEYGDAEKYIGEEIDVNVE